MKSKPATEYDDVFKKAEWVFKLMDKSYTNGHDLGQQGLLIRLGQYFASILIKEPAGVQCLHSMADALREWRSHKPKQSKAETIRVTLIALNGMFKPDQARHKKVDPKVVVDTKLIEAKGKPWPKLTVRCVIANLKEHGFKTHDDRNEILPEIRTEIQRQAKLLGIPLDPTAGRPPTSKTQQKR